MENKILNLFLINKSLKFNEIEKHLAIRSNKLAYHLKKLVDKKILDKNNDSYSLSETAENIIPYLSERNGVLAIILIMIGNDKKAFLYKRNKRPFKDFLSLPGGRLLVGESIKEAVRRIMKEKHNINVELKEVNSISLEHVKKDSKFMHSFLLIFATAKTKDKVDLTDIEKHKQVIVSSDYNLIKNNSSLKTTINTLITRKY